MDPNNSFRKYEMRQIFKKGDVKFFLVETKCLTEQLN